MKKNQVLVFSICIVSLLLASFGVVYAKEKVKPIRIGVLTDWSGVGADYGPKWQVLQELFLDEIGHKVAGRPIKVFREDSGTTPATALDKARKLVGVDRVHMIIGTIFGHVSQTISTFAAENKIPHIMWLTAHYEAVERGWSFATTYGPETSSYIAGKYAYDMGYRTATCIGSDYVSGHKFNGGALQAFIDCGGKVIQKQWAPLGTADFGPYISAMKPADVCFFWFGGMANIMFCKQYREFGLLEKMRLVMVEDTMFKEWLKEVDPKQFAGKIRGRTSYTSDLDNPLNKKFVAAFRAKTGLDPDALDYAAYETWMLTVKALEATKGDTNPEKLREAIRGIKMMTPAGPVRISQKGYPYRRSYIFEFAIRDGKFYKKLIKEYPEQSLIRFRPGIVP